MANYKVTFKKSVAKDLRKLPTQVIRKLLKCIDQLAEDPLGNGCQKLSGHDIYRVRQGKYRIIYEIRDEYLVVNVIKIGHRSSVYDNL